MCPRTCFLGVLPARRWVRPMGGLPACASCLRHMRTLPSRQGLSVHALHSQESAVHPAINTRLQPDCGGKSARARASTRLAISRGTLLDAVWPRWVRLDVLDCWRYRLIPVPCPVLLPAHTSARLPSCTSCGWARWPSDGCGSSPLLVRGRVWVPLARSSACVSTSEDWCGVQRWCSPCGTAAPLRRSCRSGWPPSQRLSLATTLGRLMRAPVVRLRVVAVAPAVTAVARHPPSCPRRWS